MQSALNHLAQAVSDDCDMALIDYYVKWALNASLRKKMPLCLLVNRSLIVGSEYFIKMEIWRWFYIFEINEEYRSARILSWILDSCHKFEKSNGFGKSGARYKTITIIDTLFDL